MGNFLNAFQAKKNLHDCGFLKVRAARRTAPSTARSTGGRHPEKYNIDDFLVYILNTEEYFSTQLKQNGSDFRSPVLFHSRKSSVVKLKFHLRLHPLALLWVCVCSVYDFFRRQNVAKRSRKAVLTKTTTDENPPTARFMIRSCRTDKLEHQFRKTYIISTPSLFLSGSEDAVNTITIIETLKTQI